MNLKRKKSLFQTSLTLKIPIIVKDSILRAEVIKKEMSHKVGVQKVTRLKVGQVHHHPIENLMVIKIATDLPETDIEIVT